MILLDYSQTDEYKQKFEKLGTSYYNKIVSEGDKWLQATADTQGQFVKYSTYEDPQLYLDVVEYLEEVQPKFFNKGQIAEQLTVGGIDWTDRQKILIIKLMFDFFEKYGAK